MADLVFKDDKYCFACGPDNSEGLKMKVTRLNGSARAEVVLRREHQGWKEMAHGGLVSTLLDEIMAHAVIDRYPHAVTARLMVRYRRPVPLGETLLVEGCISGQKKRIVIAEASVRLQETGQILATAESKFLKFKNTEPESETGRADQA
ncbi:MAG: PaaI family thioesterase [Deltaproteobacteria bacterium]|nr:PaaI family thioesterase [Deltaproteobacteria bacterium]